MIMIVSFVIFPSAQKTKEAKNKQNTKIHSIQMLN